MMWGYYPTMGWWMVLSNLLWLGLLAVAVWALVRYLAAHTRTGSRGPDQLPTSQSADEILCQRYARGEIDADTFQRMRAELDGAPRRDPALPGGQR